MAEEDLDVVGRAKSGDDAAFSALIEPRIEPGRRLALGMLPNPDAAEDAVQESCLRAWRKLHTFREGADLRPWFFGIVANQCRSIVRTRWWSVLTLAEPPHEIPAPDDSAISGADLRRELRALGHREQLAVVLFCYLDLPPLGGGGRSLAIDAVRDPQAAGPTVLPPTCLTSWPEPSTSTRMSAGRPHRRRLAAVVVLLLGIVIALTLIHLSYERTHPGVPAGNPTAWPETTPWAENLTFRGAINAETHATLADSGVIVNTCADRISRQAGDLNVTLYLPRVMARRCSLV